MAVASPSLSGVEVSVDGPPPFQPDSLLGTVVAGRYRLCGHLASGGMAAVYVAEDTVARREVALKILQPHLAAAPEAVRRFLCEGAIASLIDHENVVRVLDHGGEGRPCFIAMELLEGEGLFDRLRRQGALPAEEVVAILSQVCDGLEAAHGKGVVHRDLKPENVFLHQRPGRSPTVKIIDFGVAGGAHGEPGEVGLVVGTPQYLSPEQAYGRPAGPRSDVYSVGIMAWRMLAGRHPFTADTADDLIRMQARDPVPSLTVARPDLPIPAELVAVVARACAKDPDARPASAAELGALLRGALGRATGLPTPMPRPSFRPPGTGVPTPVRVPSPDAGPPAVPVERWRRFLRMIALAAVLAGLGLAGAALFLHGRSPPAQEGRQAAPAP